MHAFYLLLTGLVTAAAASEISCAEKAPKVCQGLRRDFGNSTLFPKDEPYTEEVQVPWSARSWLRPACIFAPLNAQQLASGLERIVDHQVEFAIRGGGHMPISNASSIGATGILISSKNMGTLHLSNDRDTLTIGPGLRWSDVYTALDGTGVTVLGGRGSPIGVSGLLLGGGVPIFSYEYGLASTNGNIKAYECVLADGSIAQVTSTNEHADLFWALQGGGNSFCLVTRFDLQTRRAPTVMIASPSYGGEEVKQQFIDSVYNFAVKGHHDPKAAVLPVITYVSGTDGPTYTSTLFYNGNTTQPAVLGDFLGSVLTRDNSSRSLAPFPMGQYHQAVAPSFQKGGRSYGSRQRFHMLPIYANKKAMLIAHDMFFEVAKATFKETRGGIIGFAFNPITSAFLAATNARPGALQGIDESPACWIEQTYSWADEADDKIFDTFISELNTRVRERLESMGALYPFYYLNEADVGQPVFESYPEGNLDRLKEIRNKYDPARVFTDLMPGGFKVAAA
ncbi:FAD binding domain-containing protein [Colletotrichum phormii]|uniref:FAD binding domain-containing protein n=1 Tax=Colletotrichum phormii TaxID=359342 RepID=A0AAI9ZKG7_9PEZI|nr:FAD binding domain-containing protein [Colletotrichum phormii]KAK1633646.1 FAD binding domain-containing protein [Colletotrichum phormii]